jgi:hypothetical protein
MISGNFDMVFGRNSVDLYNGKLVFPTTAASDWRLNIFDVKQMDSQMLFNFQQGEMKNLNPVPEYQRKLNPKGHRWGAYHWIDDQSLFKNNTLTVIAINGDTLCQFTDHGRPYVTTGGSVVNVSYTKEYRHNGYLTLVKNYNDTVFRLVPPNRLIPAYVLKWGDYKVDFNKRATGFDYEGSLLLWGWFESPRYIFMHYTGGRDYPNRRNQGKVKDYWAIYDKTTKILTHHRPSSAPKLIERSSALPSLIENDLEPVGMPFWPNGLNHRNEMYMIISKKKIEDHIATGVYRNDKLQAIYDKMTDDEIWLMIVK